MADVTTSVTILTLAIVVALGMPQARHIPRLPVRLLTLPLVGLLLFLNFTGTGLYLPISPGAASTLKNFSALTIGAVLILSLLPRYRAPPAQPGAEQR
jgi:hypothetical protein